MVDVIFTLQKFFQLVETEDLFTKAVSGLCPT
jgi:hypothetical protein